MNGVLGVYKVGRVPCPVHLAAVKPSSHSRCQNSPTATSSYTSAVVSVEMRCRKYCGISPRSALLLLIVTAVIVVISGSSSIMLRMQMAALFCMIWHHEHHLEIIWRHIRNLTVNRCYFTQIRSETTEHWAFYEGVAPRKKNSNMTDNMRSVPDQQWNVKVKEKLRIGHIRLTYQ